MKRFSFNLPYANVTFTTGVEPGSLTKLTDLPNGQICAVSASNGRSLTLNVYVAPGEHAVTEFNHNFVASEIIDEFLLGIRMNDMFDDGYGLIDLSVKDRVISLAGTAKPYSGAEANDAAGFWQVIQYNGEALDEWREKQGKRVAEHILQALTDGKRPTHDDHIQFAIESTLKAGDLVGGICFKGPNESRITGMIYFGKLDDDQMEMKANPSGSLIDRLLRHGAKQTVTVRLMRNGNDFTASLNLPFEGCEEWFARGALEKLIDDAITASITQTKRVFG